MTRRLKHALSRRLHELRRAVANVAVLFAASTMAGGAAAVTVVVVDSAQHPLADAVVYVVPVTGKLPAHGSANATIDQVDRQFDPKVTVVQTGTSVTFPNRDNIRHQVYSFSPAKIFELKLYSGTAAKPIVFDKPGLIVMGCNIHDQMVGFVEVVDTPWFGKSGVDGTVTIPGVPVEEVVVHVWHWRANDQKEVLQTVKAAPDAKVRLTVDVKT